jgi:hypothetical protein
MRQIILAISLCLCAAFTQAQSQAPTICFDSRTGEQVPCGPRGSTIITKGPFRTQVQSQWQGSAAQVQSSQVQQFHGQVATTLETYGRPADIQAENNVLTFKAFEGKVPKGQCNGFVAGCVDDTCYVLSNVHATTGANRYTVVYSDGTSAEAHKLEGNSQYDVAIFWAKDTRNRKGTVANFAQQDVRPGDAIQWISFIHATEYNDPNRAEAYAPRTLRYSRGSVVSTDGSWFNYQTQHIPKPGQSGSPLTNLQGKVVGIVSQNVGEWNYQLPQSPPRGMLQALVAKYAFRKTEDTAQTQAPLPTPIDPEEKPEPADNMEEDWQPVTATPNNVELHQLDKRLTAAEQHIKFHCQNWRQNNTNWRQLEQYVASNNHNWVANDENWVANNHNWVANNERWSDADYGIQSTSEHYGNKLDEIAEELANNGNAISDLEGKVSDNRQAIKDWRQNILAQWQDYNIRLESVEQPITHYVLAYANTDQWTSLREAYYRALDTDTKPIRLIRPTGRVGELPALVAYKSGTPQGSVAGVTQVIKALSKIADGQQPSLIKE